MNSPDLMDFNSPMRNETPDKSLKSVILRNNFASKCVENQPETCEFVDTKTIHLEEYFSNCDVGDLSEKESLGILKLEQLNSCLNNDLPDADNICKRVINNSFHTSKSFVNSPLNTAFLLPLSMQEFPSTNSVSLSSLSQFNSCSLEVKEPSNIISPNAEAVLNDAFLKSNSNIRFNSLSTSKVIKECDGASERLSLPEFQVPTDNNRTSMYILDDLAEGDDNVFENSVFIEANHLASKLADGSILITNNSMTENSLDCITPPELVEAEELEEKIVNTETIFKVIDKIAPAPIQENPTECIDNTCKTSTATEKDEFKENLNNIFNNSRKQSSSSETSSTHDPKELLTSLYSIINKENSGSKRNEKGQQLLLGLANFLCSQNKSENFDDSGHSSIEQEDQQNNLQDSYEALDLRINKSDIETGLESKTENKRLSQSFSLPSQPKSIKNENSKNNSESSSINSSKKSTLMSKLKPKKLDDKGKKISKGPLKAVIPVMDMSKRLGGKIVVASETPPKAHSSNLFKMKTSTPINEPQLKPIAQSTPGSVSSHLKKNKMENNVSPLTNSVGFNSNNTTRSSQSTSTPNLSKRDSLIPSPKFIYRRHSATDLKTTESKPSLTRSYSIGPSNKQVLMNKLKQTVSSLTNTPIKKSSLKTKGTLPSYKKNILNECNNGSIIKNMKSLNLTFRLYSRYLQTDFIMKKSVHKTRGNVNSKKKIPSKTKEINVNPPYNFTVLDNPTKSYTDKKEYKVIKLANGLTACLIADVKDSSDDSSSSSSSESDSSDGSTDYETYTDVDSLTDTGDDSDKDDCKLFKSSEGSTKLSAAALCIGVGSFSDPKDIPGLAHFLEHMVFMGSKKFPLENDFDSFITKHGGSDNASTDFEVTTFYFECFEKHLFTALDKFSQFFINPLMQRDSMTREREAVESEFQIALPSDDFRREQLLISLSDVDSPVNSFSWGNLVTLKENVSDDKLYKMLHDFRRRHYSAHRMTLAVQARLPLATLESFIVNCFSEIPSNKLPPEDFAKYSHEVFNTPQFRRLYYVKPVKDICQVDLTFPMPSLLQLYRTKPHVYLAWLIGHQGKNSLYSYLKKKVWVLSLYAGNDESGAEFNSIYATFSIRLVLTKEGYMNLKTVIESVFSYISLLKKEGPCERIFKEIQCIEDISFRFEEDESAADNVEDLVENMQLYPPVDYITGEALMFDYDADVIKMVLDRIDPNNMNIMISSSEVPEGITYDKLEPWFKTQYTDEEIPADWLQCWNEVEPFPEFALPQPNPYITTDFNILPKTKNNPEFPQKILNTAVTELWYRKDNKFELPMGYYYYSIITPYALQSVKESVLIHMYSILVNMNLDEEGYDAQLAELEYDILPSEKGINVQISGYNQKLHVLAELIGKHLTKVAEMLTEPLFNAVKEKFTKTLYNGFLKPTRLCKDIRLLMLQDNYFSLIDKHAAISKITYDEMKEFSQHFLNKVYVQGLVQGNVTRDAALKVTTNFLKDLNAIDLREEERPRIILNQIPQGEHCCRVYSFNKENPNSIITNYYQCGKSTITNTVILELILLLIEEPLFDKLRTKEQLGYKVACSLRDTYGVLGFTISVNTQADKYTTAYVDDRIENFLDFTDKMIKKLSERKFTQAKRDLIKSKHHVDIDLEDEILRNWEEIINCEYQFDRIQKEIKAIQELEIHDVRKWWEHYNTFSKHNTHRKISLQIVGHNQKEKHKSLEFMKNIITDIVSAPIVPPELKTRITSTSKAISTTLCLINPSVDTENVSDPPEENKFNLTYLGSSDEITGRRTPSYFIRNVKEFRKKLQRFENIHS
ncbi:hypothetical protein FQR65_LT11664 [Abscondita terminalis]|nr:hypothetical protein FQR65_LT11664 [Abscondita terminalis]